MSELAELRSALDGVMARDRGRLLGRWVRFATGTPPAAQIAALRADIAASAARRGQRAALRPEIRLDESLPIAARADEIVRLLECHPVLVIAGETGSGKTTQLPKLCLAAGRGAAGMIGCTQPRRIAARSVARRVAAELGSEVGKLVGFQVRFADQVGADTLVKFMTDGILLAETQSDPWLSAYDTIILDEAHERSLNIDFLLGYLKRLLAKRRDLKLIVTSATIDTARFAAHFGGAPVLTIEGRGFPVEVRWRPGGKPAAAGRLDRPSPLARERGSPAADADSGMRGIRSETVASRGRRGTEYDADPLTLAEQILAVTDEITAADPRGDVLVFLPGEREIRDAHLALSRRKYRETEVLALYARLSAAEQDRVFRPGPQRRVVLATNVAETSLTVPRIRYVIDTGAARVKRYAQRSQIERLHIEPIAQAAADQRKGRCGRTGPGVCYRLYAEDEFANRPRYTDPEILRVSLAGTILRMLSLELGDVAEFPFIDQPSSRAIADGYRRLDEIGAIVSLRSSVIAEDQKAAVHGRTSLQRLTSIGRAITRLPVDVALGRMLVEAERRGVLREMLALASFLSIQDPRERPADARQAADAAHAAFTDPRSDFIGVWKLWQAYQSAHEELTQSKLRDWCQTHFLSFLRMREWRELHRQLLLIADESAWMQPGEKAGSRGRGFGIALRSGQARGVPRAGMSIAAKTDRRGNVQPSPPHSTLTPDNGTVGGEGLSAQTCEAVHRCLLSGWPTQVGRKDEHGQYRGTRERRFGIFPGSALAKLPPQWLLAAQILDIGKVYALTCARVEPAWIEQQAAHLVKRSWRDPHWSRKRGAVMAVEQVTLFGLTLVESRVVQFGRQDPGLAQEIFVREALGRCEIDCKADFLRANAHVLAEAHELEAKQRRQGLLKSDAELAGFFAGKFPADVYTAAALDAWYRNAVPAEQTALRWSLADVLVAEPGLRAGAYPATLELGGPRLRLEYRFVPGDPADGVTLRLPLALLNAIPAARCDWLVPGLLAEKVAELIRGLPKALRRNFVPAPDFARAFVEAEAPRDEPLASALAAYLARVTGVAVGAADFASIELPAQFAMRFSVHDERDHVIAEGRDLAAIRANWTEAARAAFSRKADAELTREDVAEFDFDEIPEAVRAEGGLVAFLALVDLGDGVALRVFERAEEARTEHARGVERLLRRALSEKIKQARRQLPIHNTLALKWAPLGSVESLRADLVEGAWRDNVAAGNLDVRRRADFEHLKAELGRGLFPAAVERLRLAEAVIEANADLAPWLEPPLLGFARANYDDLREQLAELLRPGFFLDVEKQRLAQFPRYLRAMRLRAERLRVDSVRDQVRMLQVRPYWRQYLERRAARGEAALAEFRWLIEELRVSLFAQELRTPEPVSPKRLAKVAAALEDWPPAPR